MDDIRYKKVLTKINHTNNPDWHHYEKECVLQKKINDKWVDVNKVYFVKDENGVEQEIDEDEFLELSKKLK